MKTKSIAVHMMNFLLNEMLLITNNKKQFFMEKLKKAKEDYLNSKGKIIIFVSVDTKNEFLINGKSGIFKDYILIEKNKSIKKEFDSYIEKLNFTSELHNLEYFKKLFKNYRNNLNFFYNLSKNEEEKSNYINSFYIKDDIDEQILFLFFMMSLAKKLLN